MSILKDFINLYGVKILWAILTFIAGYAAVEVKRLYTKRINNSTVKDVISTCVRATEQIYKDLHGEEKLNKCIKQVSTILMEKGIFISDLEIHMLIEAAVNEFNSNLGTVEVEKE
jgi:hypothetical protein